MVVILNIHGQPVKPCDERGYQHRWSGGQVVDGVRTCKYCGIEHEGDVGKQLAATVWKTRLKKRKPAKRRKSKRKRVQRKGPERFPARNPECEIRMTFAISQEQRELLEAIGNGNASEGFRELVNRYGYALAKRPATQPATDNDELVI